MTMHDIFKKKYPLLITNVMAEGKNVDIFIDENGTIAGMGEKERTQRMLHFILSGIVGHGQLLSWYSR